ncbi:MAG: TrmH family RNA methyltransferase, partial [Spirochaetales bacterium]|nr:TrmH family RNA methyltransferase [Spirochaetales bacterium]
QVFPLQVCIDRIRSPFNVGSVFRTAESFGVEKIMLLQGSASPEHPRAERSAMGCTEIIPWKFSDDAVSELTAEQFGSGRLVGHDQFKHDQFKHDQFKLSQSPPGSPLGIFPVFALELGGTPVDEFVFPDHGIVIIGSEELGVSPELLSLADEGLGRVSIPTCGNKGSLNVSVAFGILMQHWYSSLKAVRKPVHER